MYDAEIENDFFIVTKFEGQTPLLEFKVHLLTVLELSTISHSPPPIIVID